MATATANMYAAYTVEGELPPSKTYPIQGQRTFFVRAPGVVSWRPDGSPAVFCLFTCGIKQRRGKKLEEEAYHVQQADVLQLRQKAPRDRLGWFPDSGYLFECFTAEPTPERPGLYLVACDRAGVAYWCGCLGARGHRQDSNCKHRDLINKLGEREPTAAVASEKRA